MRTPTPVSPRSHSIRVPLVCLGVPRRDTNEADRGIFGISRVEAKVPSGDFSRLHVSVHRTSSITEAT
jgi:hypothetical protein